ncbi:MAG: biopolymer transporter ExbD, partial [Kiritimatiellia bacterium]
MRLHKKKNAPPEVAMSPLIDAVFLLLIFFLVATMYKKKDRDIDILPPVSRSASRVLTDDKNVMLGVDREGTLFWEGVPSSRGEIHRRIRELGLNDPDRQVRVDADAEAPFEQVAELLNL